MKTLTLNFRGDVRDIALLVAVYEDIHHKRIVSKATVIRLAISDYAALLTKKYADTIPIAKEFKSTNDAIQFLRQRGLMQDKDFKENKKERVDAINLDLLDELDERVLNTSKLEQSPDVVKRAGELAQDSINE